MPGAGGDASGQETTAAKDDIPSVRISLKVTITVCAFPERCLCLYPHAGSKESAAAMAQGEADGRDVPSVRISLQLTITVCAFPERCLYIYPPAVCTHPLPSQRLSRRQCTLTAQHRHSSVKLRTHFRYL